MFGVYANLIPEFMSSDALAYKNFLRMDNDSFALLLEKVQSRITRQNTIMRQAIGPAERLAVTLRFLATGMTYMQLLELPFLSESLITGRLTP